MNASMGCRTCSEFTWADSHILWKKFRIASKAICIIFQLKIEIVDLLYDVVVDDVVIESEVDM